MSNHLRAHFSTCILWLQRDWPLSQCDCGVLTMEAMDTHVDGTDPTSVSLKRETGTLAVSQGNLLISGLHGLCGEG